MKTSANTIKRELFNLQKELQQKQHEFDTKKTTTLSGIDHKLTLLSKKIQKEFPEKNQEVAKPLKEIQTHFKTLASLMTTYQALLEQQIAEVQDDTVVNFATYVDSIYIET